MEAPRDRLVFSRIHPQREVCCGQHHRGHGACDGSCACRRRVTRQIALEAAHWCAPAGLLVSSHSYPEERVEVARCPTWSAFGVHAPFESARDRVGALAAAHRSSSIRGPSASIRQLPFGLGADVLRSGSRGTVGLAEGVAAGDEGHGLLVVHRHAGEGLADVTRRGQRIRIAVGALGVHVDQDPSAPRPAGSPAHAAPRIGA